MSDLQTSGNPTRDTVQDEASADSRPGVVASVVLVLGICGLIVAWPMPHVIALRNTFVVLLTGLVFLSPPLRTGLLAVLRRSRPAAIYFMFLGWTLAVALFISGSPGESLVEMKAEWLPSTLALIIGLAAGVQIVNKAELGIRLRWAVVIALFSHPIFHVLFGLALVVPGYGLPTEFAGLMDHRANVTYINALALAFVFADLLFRIRWGRGLTGDPRIAVVGLGFVAASSILAVTRNGVITLLVLSVVFASVALTASRISNARKIAAALVFLLLCAAYSFVAIKIDSRWQRLVATAPVAWDIDTHHTWIDSSKYPPPPAADGGRVDVSAYERIAWARLGSRFVLEHPFGTEISRAAFKHLVAAKYGEAYMGHSHVGYIDLAISVGFPGLLLWLAFIGLLMASGWRAYRTGRSIWGLILLFTVAGYAIRCGIDSIIRDHILEEFMFFAGLSAAALATEERAPNNRAGRPSHD